MLCNTVLDKDYDEAVQLNTSTKYHVDKALALIMDNEYSKAVKYLQDAIRSLDELQRLKNKKQMTDELLNVIGTVDRLEDVKKRF